MTIKRQIDGVATGFSSGPVLANILMCHFEEKGFLTTTLALTSGFDTLTIPSPCSTVKHSNSVSTLL